MIVPGSANALLLASAGAPAGYQIERSLRFNSSDSAYLSRTPASAGNRKTWTWSGWLKRSTLGANTQRFFIGGVAGAGGGIQFESDTLFVFDFPGSLVWSVQTAAVFRDTSSWYHVVVAIDTTQSISSNRVKLYVNGLQQTALTATYPTPNYDGFVNSGSTLHTISSLVGSQDFFSGYLADIHFIDGQALDPTSFAETNITTGQWVPKAYTGTYGTNGFRLAFADNSNNTATTLGKDSSGNGNNWTPNNLSVTAGAGNDSLVDTPTSYGTDTGAGGEVRGNYCVWNPLDKDPDVALANGNLDMSQSNAGFVRGTLGVSAGKWYWEVVAGTGNTVIGVANSDATPIDAYVGASAKAVGWAQNSFFFTPGVTAAGGSPPTYTSGDVIGVALNMDTGVVNFYKNGSIISASASGLTGNWFPAIGTNVSATTSTTNFGQRQWAYQAPAGFKALCDTNLPAPVVAKPNTAFDVALWTGNGSARSITGLNFNPDFVWIKGRSGATDHALYDVVRGTEKRLESNNTDTEVTSDGGVTAFNSDGFSLGTLAQVNTNTATYAGWTWDAGSSTVTNTQGSITSSVRANTAAGFSIVSFTTQASGSATVGHGLGVAPTFFITKARGVSNNWWCYHASLSTPQSNAIALNLTNAALGSTTLWNNTAPTSSVINLGSDWAGSNALILYAFAPVGGYSSFGSYTGNGSTDGPFVYTGFRPRWLILKATAAAGGNENWCIKDALRPAYNVTSGNLYANLSLGEDNVSTVDVDLLSNGFKLRGTYSGINTNAVTYIYAVFAENPFQYARAR